MATLYIKNTETLEELPENIIRCRHCDVKWLDDNVGFFYTRNPRPGAVPKNEEHMHTKVYFHALGSDPETDEMGFGFERPKEDMIQLNLSPDGRYLGIEVSQGWISNDVFYMILIRKK